MPLVINGNSGKTLYCGSSSWGCSCLRFWFLVMPMLSNLLPQYEKTSQDKIIEQLESDIERHKLEIFEMKGEIKILKQMLKDASAELQKTQGYDDDGNYIE